MRLLVCGPRNLTAAAMPLMVNALLHVLEPAQPYAPGFVMAHGAARGGDLLWQDALAHVVELHPDLWMPIRPYRAKWRLHERAAGPIRNRLMLKEVEPTHWLAAAYREEPDTPGTADMVGLLREAGVPGSVLVVPRAQS